MDAESTWRELWEALQARYRQALDNGDPRVADWPLMQSIFPTLALCVGYLVMCWAGPRLMANRRPLEPKALMMVYNFAVVLLSLYMFLEIYLTTSAMNYTYVCDEMSYSFAPNPSRLAAVLWLYYFSKIIEFLDTLFFILRKNNHQITFLHVYHHCTMVFLWWIGAKWFAGGASFLSAMVNCLVHVVMYSYYFLSALGPAVRRYLWWKKYITLLQLVQFAVLLAHVCYVLYCDCNFDKRTSWALVVYLLSHLALFSNFYFQSYLRKGQPSRGRSKGQEGTPNGSAPTNGSISSSKKGD